MNREYDQLRNDAERERLARIDRQNRERKARWAYTEQAREQYERRLIDTRA